MIRSSDLPATLEGPDASTTSPGAGSGGESQVACHSLYRMEKGLKTENGKNGRNIAD